MATVQRYRKKPVTIEAMRLPVGATPAEAHAVYQWIETNTLGSFEPLSRIEGREPWPPSGVSIDPRDGRMIIATLEGGHWVSLGDYVIRGVQGEFYPCRADIFEQTYDEVRKATPSDSASWADGYRDSDGTHDTREANRFTAREKGGGIAEHAYMVGWSDGHAEQQPWDQP